MRGAQRRSNLPNITQQLLNKTVSRLKRVASSSRCAFLLAMTRNLSYIYYSAFVIFALSPTPCALCPVPLPERLIPEGTLERSISAFLASAAPPWAGVSGRSGLHHEGYRVINSYLCNNRFNIVFSIYHPVFLILPLKLRFQFPAAKVFNIFLITNCISVCS